MIENVSQIMDDNNQISDHYMINDDIDDEIEIISNEDIEALDNSSEDEVNDDKESTSMVDTDDSVLTFSGHKKAVLCCGLSSDKRYAVSGGEDDLAVVWKTDDLSVVFECLGHKDSVIGVAFNSNDSYIATADMNGLIQIWNISGNKVFDFEVEEINWISWHPIVPNVLMAGTASGDAWMWKLNSSLTSECKTFQSFGKSNSSAKCFSDGKRIAMGYEDGVIRLWDLKTTAVIHSITGSERHSGTVTCIDCSEDNALIGSGSIDCTAKIINSLTGKVLTTFECSNTSNNEENSDSVESIGFSSVNSLFGTGTVDGSLDIWDIPTQVKRHSLKQSAGISKLLWDQNSAHLLYTAGLDGILNVYDTRNGQQMNCLRGHSDHILDFSISKDSALALTSSEDKTCKIFSLL